MSKYTFYIWNVADRKYYNIIGHCNAVKGTWYKYDLGPCDPLEIEWVPDEYIFG